MSVLSQSLIDFRDEHLHDRNKVGIYRKSKKYARYGGYISAVLWYSALVTYGEYWPTKKGTILVLLTVAIISTLLSLKLRSKYKNMNLDAKERSMHDIAVLIDAFGRGGYEGLIEEYDQTESYIPNNILLSEVRKDSLLEYLLEVESQGEEFATDTFNENFELIVNDVKMVLNDSIDSALDDASKSDSIGDTPSRFEVLFSAVGTSTFNHNTVFWATFILVAIIGIGVAVWRGQGWGVLTVTILFAGLRYYDNRS